MHVLAGLKKGDSISISRESLPGAVLFPGIKYKEVKEPSAPGAGQVEESEKGKPSSAAVDAAVGDVKSESASTDEAKDTSSIPSSSTSTSSLPFVMPQSPTQVHRFLVVTRERFIVLDSGGSGIGSTAIVKSNHHLTEVT
jgi:hypothetical protein